MEMNQTQKSELVSIENKLTSRLYLFICIM